MNLTRTIVAMLALASFTVAFAEGNGVAASHQGAIAATAPRKTPEPATNTRCPVMGGKVDASSPTVIVDGRQYRLCCPDCGDKVKADPDHYLNKNGTLVGAWENTSYVNHI